MYDIWLRGGPLDGQKKRVRQADVRIETRDKKGTLLGWYNRKNQMGITSNIEAQWENNADR